MQWLFYGPEMVITLYKTIGAWARIHVHVWPHHDWFFHVTCNGCKYGEDTTYVAACEKTAVRRQQKRTYQIFTAKISMNTQMQNPIFGTFL